MTGLKRGAPPPWEQGARAAARLAGNVSAVEAQAAAIEGRFPVTAPDIAPDAVTTAAIAPDAVTNAEVAPGFADGETITGAVFQTSVPGVGHTTIMLDGPNNLQKFYAGLTSETPGNIDPTDVSGNPAVTIKPGTTPSITHQPSLQLVTRNSTSLCSIQAETFNVDAIQGIGAGFDTWQVACTSAASPTSTTNVTIAGLSQAVTSPGTTAVYLVTIAAYVETPAVTENIIELLVDGTAQTAQIRTISNSYAVTSPSKTWRITGLSAGSHTFTARTRSGGAYSTAVAATHTLMTVERKA